MICVAKHGINKEEETLLQVLVNDDLQSTPAAVIQNGLWEWHRDSNQVVYSSRWKSMVGCQETEIRNSPIEWFVRVHPRDIARLRSDLANCWRGKISQLETEYSLLHQDGEYRTMRCKCVAIKNDLAQVECLFGSQTDISISKQKKVEAKLNYQSDLDQLTNLPNRQAFIGKLTNLSAALPNCDYQFSVLCLDIDRFQYINHSFGNKIGDLLLIEIVARLRSCLRAQDSIARMDGDEFAFLLMGLDNSDYAVEVASKIQQEFASPLKIEQFSILVSVSIGISYSHSVTRRLEQTNQLEDCLIDCLRNAQIAMRQAKSEGKACSKVFEPAIHSQIVARFKEQDDLREALEQKQLELYYQPIVELKSDRVVGFETLIRWQHPLNGLVMPSHFIPLAERTGLIMPIGWWVLRSACQQMAQWHQKISSSRLGSKLPFLSVNITSQQLSQSYAGDMITEIINQTGLDPRYLKLEITESEIIANIEAVLNTAQKLKSLEIQLSMDDFGTGYSSLSYLHCLPVDTLKIDRSFVKDIETDHQQLELVKAILKLAQVFNLDVVAEGIERIDQSRKLLDLECKYGQGYLYSKPVPGSIAIALL